MKTTYQGYLLILAAAISTALPHPEASVTQSAPANAVHTADAAPTIAYDRNTSLTAVEVADIEAKTKHCFHINSDNPNWHFSNSGVWGEEHGQFGKGVKKICVAPNDGAGGAMFIGSEKIIPNVTPGGNTKLECFFPTSGLGNCDMSLVDGYSLSMKCDLPENKHVGGTTDLWKTGKNCVDKSMEKQGICINAQGNDGTQAPVTDFFKVGIHNGNNYCTFDNCGQDPTFPTGKARDIHCHVSGSNGPKRN